MDNILALPGEVPADPTTIPDGTLISTAVWALLQGRAAGRPEGILRQSVTRMRARSKKNREAGKPQRGDMPPEDQMIGEKPYWKMGTFRAWLPTRPGIHSSPGRPVGTGRPIPNPPMRAGGKLPLPAGCPHCQWVITVEDVNDQRAGRITAGQFAAMTPKQRAKAAAAGQLAHLDGRPSSGPASGI